MGQHATHRLRTDLFAVTGVSLLVVAVAVAAVLSIIAGSRAAARDDQLVTEFVGVTGSDGVGSPARPSGDLVR